MTPIPLFPKISLRKVLVCDTKSVTKWKHTLSPTLIFFGVPMSLNALVALLVGLMLLLDPGRDIPSAGIS